MSATNAQRLPRGPTSTKIRKPRSYIFSIVRSKRTQLIQWRAAVSTMAGGSVGKRSVVEQEYTSIRGGWTPTSS